MRLPILNIIAVLMAIAAGFPVNGALAQAQPVARADLTGIEPLPLTGKRRAAFEAYVADALYRFEVPGAAVAVVENGEVIYLNGFGVTEMDGTRPVTPDTMMMIGSITKSMSATLAAALVDSGQIGWDTRLVDLLPEFTVADEALTERLTVRDAFCNCSGVPGLNLETYFDSSSLTPETVVTSLADVAAAAPYGEQFIYNNLLVASGGYALGVANGGGGVDDLGLAYDVALRERILAPMGMTRTTFDADAVLAEGDYALPHAVDMSGELKPLPVLAERGLMSFRPAGGLWSNAREMARYLQTELAVGVAPGGTRVVSEENLQATWEPGVSVPNLFSGPPEMAATMTRYGLGWMDGTYRGLRLINHAGGSAGYSAKMAFLPEADLGIVILTNALSIAPVPLGFEFAVQFRLLELVFDQPAEFDASLSAHGAKLAAARPPIELGEVEPAAVEPFLGNYDNDELGEVRLSLRGDRLVLDVGELVSELKPRADGDPSVYLLHDPPLSLYSEGYGATVRLSGAASDRRVTVKVPASVTGPEQVYVFRPAAGS